MTSRDYDERLDDTDVTDEMVAKLNATCVSMAAKRAAVAESHAKRVRKRGKEEAGSMGPSDNPKAAKMWKASVAGLAVRLGEETANPSYGFAEAAKIVGVACKDIDRDTYTQGQVVRRWAREAMNSADEGVKESFNEAAAGRTFIRGWPSADGVNGTKSAEGDGNIDALKGYATGRWMAVKRSR